MYMGAPVLLARLGSSRHVPRSSTMAGQAHSRYPYRLAHRRREPVRTSMPTRDAGQDSGSVLERLGLAA